MDIQKDNRIYQFQSDYINGTGSHGEVHKQYAAALGKYKALYEKCPIFFATGVADLQMGENGCLKKGVITDAVLLLLSLLAWQLDYVVRGSCDCFRREMVAGRRGAGFGRQPRGV